MSSYHYQRTALIVTLKDLRVAVNATRVITLRDGNSIILGRESKNSNSSLKQGTENGYFDNPIVSRIHATLENRSGQLYITDKNSTHGTFVNNVKLLPEKEIRIQSQDTIKLGVPIEKFDNHPTELLITLQEPEQPTPAVDSQSYWNKPFGTSHYSRKSYYVPDSDSENELEDRGNGKPWKPFAVDKTPVVEPVTTSRAEVTVPSSQNKQKDDSFDVFNNEDEVSRQIHEGLINLLEGIVPRSTGETKEDAVVVEDIEIQVEDSHDVAVEQDPLLPLPSSLRSSPLQPTLKKNDGTESLPSIRRMRLLTAQPRTVAQAVEAGPIWDYYNKNTNDPQLPQADTFNQVKEVLEEVSPPATKHDQDKGLNLPYVYDENELNLFVDGSYGEELPDEGISDEDQSDEYLSDEEASDEEAYLGELSALSDEEGYDEENYNEEDDLSFHEDSSDDESENMSSEDDSNDESDVEHEMLPYPIEETSTANGKYLDIFEQTQTPPETPDQLTRKRTFSEIEEQVSIEFIPALSTQTTAKPIDSDNTNAENGLAVSSAEPESREDEPASKRRRVDEKGTWTDVAKSVGKYTVASVLGGIATFVGLVITAQKQ